MKKVWILILCLAVLSSTIMGCSTQKPSDVPSAQAEQQEKPEKAMKISIGSGTPGSNFFNSAAAMGTLITTKYSGKYEAVAEVSAASTGNVALLQAGEVAFGMCATDTAWEAYNGKFDYEGKAFDSLRAVFPAFPGVYMFITTPSTGVKSVSDFNGKAFSGGTAGSANQVMTNRVFDLFGIKTRMSNLPNTDASKGLGDGLLAGFTHTWPSSVVTEFETSHDSKIILLSEDEQKKFLEKYPQYLVLSIPAGYYKGLPEGGKNIGLFSLLVSSSKVDENLVYDVVKVIYENVDYWKTAYPAIYEALNPANIPQTTVPYHAGVVKYFREKGYDIPANLIPPECSK